jgi:beta-galactosidase/beta-glucuronidase
LTSGGTSLSSALQACQNKVAAVHTVKAVLKVLLFHLASGKYQTTNAARYQMAHVGQGLFTNTITTVSTTRLAQNINFNLRASHTYPKLLGFPETPMLTP